MDAGQISCYRGIPIEYRKYAAVFEQDKGLYWLHHDLASNGVVQLCNSCHRSLFHLKKGQMPPNAMDVGLYKLDFVEEGHIQSGQLGFPLLLNKALKWGQELWILGF